MGLRLGAIGREDDVRPHPGRAGQPRGRRQPRPFPLDHRRRGPAEGALDRRDRLRRLGPARLARRDRRALDADARPARAAGRAVAARGLCSPRSCGPQIALADALGAPVAVPVSPALATLLSINAWLLGWRLADARRLHHRRLWLARRACAPSRAPSSPTSSPSSPRAAPC